MVEKSENLRVSVQSGLLWGVGSTLGRDVIQFAAMLIMVRLLNPEIYGQAALAQTIIGFLAIASFKSLAGYALQARDPRTFDWAALFSAAVFLNLAAFIITIGIAFCLGAIGGTTFEALRFVLLAMSPIFLLEIGSTYQTVWLQANHRWAEFRLLILSGSLLAAVGGLAIAWAGGGVLALAFASWALGIPLAVAFLVSRERPALCPVWPRNYRDGWMFGLNRGAAGGVASGVGLVEHSVLTGLFGFASLGAYTRAIGLAQLTSGRVGPLITQTLYPVLTRAEPGTDRFRRFSAILTQGIVWISLPAATFVALEAEAAVALLYGPGWASVAPILPLTCAFVALQGLTLTVNQVILANLRQGVSLRLDLLAAATKLMVVALALPLGLTVFLSALVLHGLAILVVTLVAGARTGAIDYQKTVRIFLPPVAAITCAAALVAMIPELVQGSSLFLTFVQLAVDGLVFATVYMVVIILLARNLLFELLDAIPLGRHLKRMVGIVLPQSLMPTTGNEDHE
ncbi:MAG: oligosaccharide flippase family protein [Pseudomonadota bacterium]